MNIISISGLAGAGKDTLSHLITQHFIEKNISVAAFSFAGPLKDALCLWTGWDRARLDSDSAYKEGGIGNTNPEDVDPYCVALGMTRREIMQRFGTEAMRNGMHRDFWVILAELGVKRGVVPAAQINIIPDARFLNELQFVYRMKGVTIKIVRHDAKAGGTLTEHGQHASEVDWQKWPNFTYTLSNYIHRTSTGIPELYPGLMELKTSAAAMLVDIEKRFGL